jgi:hypothetical protein
MTPSKKKNLIKFGFLCGLVCWQICIISFFVLEPFSQGDGLTWRRSASEYFASDFLHYYTAGVVARSADRLRIYDVPVHFPYLNALIAPRVITQHSIIQFSPPMVAIMSLVSLMPLVPAYIIWTITVSIFGAIALFLLLKRVNQLSNYEIVIFIVASSASLNSLTAYKMGQWTWLLIGLFCFYFMSTLQKKNIRSAIYLGLLTVKPQYCLPLIILMGLDKRILSLVIVGAIVAASSLWAVTLIGWDNVLHYPQIVAAIAVRPDLQVDKLSFCSLRSFISTFLPIDLAITITSILYFTSLAVFALVCFLHRGAIEKNIYWVWSIAILISLIFSPYMFQYDALLACLPAALTLKTINPILINKIEPLSLKIWHWVFLFYPLFTWVRGLLGNDLNYLYSFLYIGLLFCALSYLKNRNAN